MQPCKYEKVAKCLTTLDIKPGYAIHLQDENAKVDIWTDVNLQNPGFFTNFGLPPGSVGMKVEGGNITTLSIKPDLKNFNAQLEIKPLQNGAFNFAINKKLDALKSCLRLEYNSEISQGKVTLSPKFEYKGVKIDGQFTFNGVKEEQPIILIDHLKAKFENFALCSCYNLKEKEARAAVFVNLKKAKAGTLLHFSKDCTLKEADIFAKTKIRGFKISTISSVLAQKKYTVKLEKCCKEMGAFGASATCSEKGIDFAAGFKAPIKFADLKVVLNGKRASEYSAGLSAQVKFPIKELGDAQFGVCIPNITAPSKLGYNFEIALKH